MSEPTALINAFVVCGGTLEGLDPEQRTRVLRALKELYPEPKPEPYRPSQQLTGQLATQPIDLQIGQLYGPGGQFKAG